MRYEGPDGFPKCRYCTSINSREIILVFTFNAIQKVCKDLNATWKIIWPSCKSHSEHSRWNSIKSVGPYSYVYLQQCFLNLGLQVNGERLCMPFNSQISVHGKWRSLGKLMLWSNIQNEIWKPILHKKRHFIEEHNRTKAVLRMRPRILNFVFPIFLANHNVSRLFVCLCFLSVG